MNIGLNSSHYGYRHTETWIPLGAGSMAVVLLVMALSVDSTLSALVLLGATGACGWAASVYFERVQLHLDIRANRLNLTRRYFSRGRMATQEYDCALSELTAVRLHREPVLNGGCYQIFLRLSDEWVPLTHTLSNTGSPEAEHLRLARWLSHWGVYPGQGSDASFAARAG